MDLKLKDKAVMVTGGSRGIGRQIALSFAEEGARIALCARDQERLEKAAAEVRAYGVECVTISADLAEAEGCDRAVAETVAAFGGIDILINNAGANADNAKAKLKDKDDDQLLMRVGGKALAAIRCSRAAVEHMEKAGWGRIICIAGMSARQVPRFPETASKEGNPMVTGLGNAMIANFGKNLADQYAGAGILVNVIHPGLTKTDRHPGRMARRAKQLGLTEAEAEADLIKYIPIGRIVEPTDIAPLVLLLASPVNGAITGQTIAVEGAMSRNITY